MYVLVLTRSHSLARRAYAMGRDRDRIRRDGSLRNRTLPGVVLLPDHRSRGFCLWDCVLWLGFSRSGGLRGNWEKQKWTSGVKG